MATVIPPPSKRQKLEAADKAQREAEFARIPDDLGSVRIQFVDQASGNATGPVVAVPVKDATVKNLETVLNTIQGRVGQYHLTPPRERYGSLSNVLKQRRLTRNEFRQGLIRASVLQFIFLIHSLARFPS